jgi:hypothetical protein
LCAFAEDRQSLQGSDIDEIRHELLVSTDDILQNRKKLSSSPDSAKSIATGGETSALERIAAALESIDARLEAMSEPTSPKIKIFEEARRRIKEGK